MSFLKSIMTPIVRAFYESGKAVADEYTDKAKLETKLAAATGLDGVTDILIQERKDKKAREEKKAIRESLLNI